VGEHNALLFYFSTENLCAQDKILHFAMYFSSMTFQRLLLFSKQYPEGAVDRNKFLILNHGNAQKAQPIERPAPFVSYAFSVLSFLRRRCLRGMARAAAVAAIAAATAALM
jgi:hypothetical protein